MGVGNLPFNLSDIQAELGSTTDTLSGLGLEANPPFTVPFNQSEFANYTDITHGFYHNDGVNDYGQITGGAGSNAVGSGRMTISFWVKQNAPTHHNAQLINIAPGFDKNNRVMIDYNTSNSKLRFNHRQGSTNTIREYYMSGNAGVTGLSGSWTSGNRGNTYNNTGWTMLTWVYDGGRSGLSGLTVYWNDTIIDFQASANGNRGNLAMTNLRIGENIHSVGSAGNANMDFDGIKVYDRLLDGGEVAQMYNNGPTGPEITGPIVNLTFNNGTFIDEAGHFSNSGTTNNGGNIQNH